MLRELKTTEQLEAERETEKQRVAAQRELLNARSAAKEASRKRNREGREACEPCLCTPSGAAELLRESQQQTRDALKLLESQGKITTWLHGKHKAASNK